MKIYYTTDEEYPVYNFDTEKSSWDKGEFELDSELWIEYQEAKEKFEKIERKIINLINLNNK